MSEQELTHAERADLERADAGRGPDRTERSQDGTTTDLERFGLGPEDQDPAADSADEILSGADATQERDSSLNRFGLGPQE